MPGAGRLDGVFRRTFFVASALIAALVPLSARQPALPPPAPPLPANTFSSPDWLLLDIGGLHRYIFELALSAASCAVRAGSIDDLTTLTVIDYTRSSTEKRLWVFDLHTKELLFKELVAHGRGSGSGNYATAFSNGMESHKSSLGLFRTDETYYGDNGYSLRLRGLDQGFNDLAYDRAIVMHGAPYVTETVARTYGRLDRSLGCPALSDGIAREVIDTVKGGHGLVFAYYPDPQWLAASKYLGNCAAVPVGVPAPAAISDAPVVSDTPAPSASFP